MKPIAGFLLTFCICLSSVLANPWEQAREAYDAGEFDQALALYRGLRREGVSAALDYNIGNTLMRMGRSEEALAHYRRARWLAPGDPDVRANLSMAAEQTGARIPALPAPRRLSGFLEAREWQALLIAGCWLLAAAGLGRRWLPALRQASAWILPALGLLTLLAGAGVYGSRPGPMLREAVLRGETVTARFEPLADATEHFSLPGGSVVEVADRVRTWVKIEADGKRGWVEKGKVLTLSEL